MANWQDKANRIIAELCLAEYRKVNQLSNGSYRRKTKPIHVPQVAKDLVECLGSHNVLEAEEKAKAIFIKLALIPESAND